MSIPVLKKIIIAGATGSVGAPILTALLNEPSLDTTILTRASSSAKFPAGVPVKTISDAYTVEELTEAFRGQDAVVVALSTGPVTKDDLAFRIIDAAIAAGVKRFVPSEFGADNLDPRARKLVPIYDAKGKMLEYLNKRANESNGSFTWTSFACGSWLDWALNPAKSGNFLGIDVKNCKATVWDSGDSKFSITTSSNTGLAVVRALLKPAETANQQIFLTDFVTSSNEIISSLEKRTGEKFAVEKKESGPELIALRKKYDEGDFNAAFGLLALSFVADVDVGYDFPKERKIWNGQLGLPEQSLDEVVKEAVELANRS
ncbi:NAD(P)-binding protein [Westerdykella ornata]|uniref:NAD(P)-binding protein n=1 Tax=Westerdykella ornata TaxID=318751 RepID=A0A6A6J7P9_WESOR|nr:NAD(P)-binding protein [Westerdykella ornata]KAF2272028.1 NAD(P)-binding protein [Westerdykella ornata]